MITTKIHGKTYDLTNFNHPGGITPLHLINKNDVHHMPCKQTFSLFFFNTDVKNYYTLIYGIH